MSAPPENEQNVNYHPNQATTPLNPNSGMSYQQQQAYNPNFANPYPQQQYGGQGPPPPGFNMGDQQQGQGTYYPPPPPMPMHGSMFNRMENGQSGNGDPDGKWSFQFSEKSIRNAFIRKVFSLVFIMLCIVTAIAIVPWLHPQTMRMFRYNRGIYWGAYIVFLVTYLMLVCCESVRRKFPMNLIVTAIFTIATGFMTSVLCAHYDIKVIFMSLGVCIACTLGIVIFASQTKFDLTAHVGYIFVAGLVFMFFGIFAIIGAIFFHLRWIMMLYGLIGALMMMMYLFFDVQMLMGGRKLEISPEDHIFAAVQIFMDIVQMFWMLLTLFGNSD